MEGGGCQAQTRWGWRAGISSRARLGRAIRFGKFPGTALKDGEKSYRTGGWEQMVNPGQDGGSAVPQVVEGTHDRQPSPRA